jgi:hypothetical protein
MSTVDAGSKGASPDAPNASTKSAAARSPTASQQQASTSQASALSSTHTPVGRFADRLQMLFSPTGGSNSLNVNDAANQQSQLGAMIGNRLFSATGLTSGDSTTHRSASLLGQALTAGSDSSLGLRTSASSSGTFGLVGAHSVSDIMSGPGDRGGLMSASAALAAVGPGTTAARRPTVNVNSLALAELHHGMTAGPDAAGALGGMRSMAMMDDEGGGDDPPLDVASFTLTAQFGGVPESPQFTLTETGVVNFVDGWDISSPTFPLSVAYSYAISDDWLGATIASGDVTWSGDATPAGLLYGYDIDQANDAQFGYLQGFSTATVASYTLDASGNYYFAASDAGTPVDQNQNVTTQHNYGSVLVGMNYSTLHIDGSGSARQINWNQGIGGNTYSHDNGADTTSPTSVDPTSAVDTFTSDTSGTHSEYDHTEGTLDADGTFHVTSFSFDSTDDYDFDDETSGSSSQPEPGGSETDAFSESDSGHSTVSLSASGTLDNWTASFDDDSQSTYSDQDNGSESESQSANGGTDTNSDGFHEDDSGSHSDDLHISGTGDATTFTVTSVSDRIEDVSDFHESDDGTAGEATGTESDSDHYTEADDGHADEVLTISGGASSLTATYTDQVHDDFSDSDAEYDGWNDPADHDTGHDNSTDGDSGSENVHLTASATLSDWQSDTPGDWQIGSVGADVTGTTAVQATDDGIDTEAANQDSDVEHYTDGTTGTETFAIHLTGAGASSTVSQTATFQLATHSEDDNTDGWDDPESIDGESGDEHGSEEIDDIEDTTSTVSVSEQSTIDAAGAVTPGASTVDVNAGGTAHLTDDGSDDGAAPGVDDQESVHDDAQLGQGQHIHAVTNGGATTVNVDQNLNGTLTLGGTENDTDNHNPADEYTDVANGTLGGTFGGNLHEGGTISADGTIQGVAPSGGLTLNLNGSSTDTNVERETPISTPIDGPIPASALTNFTELPSPIIYAWYGIGDRDSAGLATIVTLTRTTNCPSVHLSDTDAETGGAWAMGSLDYSKHEITSLNGVGTFNSAGGNGTATYSDVDDVTTSDAGSATALHGSRTDRDTVTVQFDGTSYDSPDVTVMSHYRASKTTTDTVSGDEGPGGADGGFTETRTVTASAHRYGHVDDHMDGNYLYFDYDGMETQNYSQTVVDSGDGNPVLTAVHGFDFGVYTADGGYETATDTSEWHESVWQELDRSLGDGGEVEADSYGDQDYWGWVTNNATEDVTPFDLDNPLPTIAAPRDWFQTISDFSAGLSDKYTAGLTQRIRGGLGYDDVVDHNGSAYKAGEVTGTVLEVVTASVSPCQKVKWLTYGIKGISAVQGTGHALNAADAAKSGDPLGFAEELFAAQANFGKLGDTCFAAGTPIGMQYGCKAVEAIREHDGLLAIDERDPNGTPKVRRVIGTYQRVAPIWELYVGKRVIRTTQEHPFYVRGRGWTPLAEIKAGDELRTGEGGWIRCDGVENTRRSETVYNVEVEGDHTYFVGDPVTWGFSLWAHNYNKFPNNARGRAAYAKAVAKAEQRYPKLAGKVHQHHIEPKYMGGAANGPTKEVNAAYHQQITNSIREKWAFGMGKAGDKMKGILEKVYKNVPLPPG